MEGWRGVGLGGGERERLERERERESSYAKTFTRLNSCVQDVLMLHL